MPPPYLAFVCSRSAGCRVGHTRQVSLLPTLAKHCFRLLSAESAQGVNWNPVPPVCRGEVINGGFGLVLDGTPEAEQKARMMLSWDVSNGVSCPQLPQCPLLPLGRNETKFWACFLHSSQSLPHPPSPGLTP